MKLVSCYVAAFGTLKDFSYKFGGGLNTVKEDNGWGKSTFSTFIKAMFYGLDDRSRNLEDNERKRFAPWNSTEKFGGNLVFEWEGKNYKIERFFGVKASEDTVKLYDEATGRVYTDGVAVENLGKRVFSIDEEGFLSTVYFSQKDFQIKSNTSITAKFNEVCEVKDSEAFDKAMEKIDGKIKELKARGDKGRISEIKRRVSIAEDRIETAKNAVAAAAVQKENYRTVTEECEILKKNIKGLTDRMEKSAKSEADAARKLRFDAAGAEIAELKTRKAAADRLLNGKTVTEESVKDCEKCVRDFNDISFKEAAIKSAAEYAEVGALAGGAKDGAKSVKPVAAIMLIAGLLTVGVGFAVAVLFISPYLFIVAAVFAALCFYFAARFITIKKRSAERERERALTAEIYGRRKKEAEELAEEKGRIRRALDGFFGNFVFGGETSDGDKLSALKDAVRVSAELKERIGKLEREREELFAAGIETDSDGESVLRLKEDLRAATEWLQAKLGEAERIKTRIAELEETADKINDYRGELSLLKEELSACESEYKTLTRTAEFLRGADETLKTRYRAPLQESLNRYVKKMAGEEASVSIDTDMRVTVNVFGAERETDFFSKGYKNLFDICKRFALTDVLFTGEKPFIILDDPFYNLDENKVRAATELIRRLAEDYQILYLICHDSRRA